MPASFSWDRAAEQSMAKAIIRNADSEQLVSRARAWADALAEGQQEASKAQIRRIFGEIKQIEMRWQRDEQRSIERLRMLKPRLHYAAARPNVGRGLGRLRDVLEAAIDAVLEAQERRVQTERFRTFVRLTEAILAYFSARKGGEGK